MACSLIEGEKKSFAPVKKNRVSLGKNEKKNLFLIFNVIPFSSRVGKDWKRKMGVCIDQNKYSQKMT